MSSRARKRKRRAEALAAAPPARPTRSELRNAEAREKLEPLEPGERPMAVTVAAVVAFVLAATEVGFWAAGYEIRGDRAALPGVVMFTLLLLAMAWGLWKSRYWAVLGMQALLALAILLFSLALMVAADLAAVLISLGVIVPAGALFWFLVKAMARIQMPARR